MVVIRATPLDAPHDHAVTLVNDGPEASLAARWVEAGGAVFQTEIVVPAGAHNADELGLFSTLARVTAPSRAPSLDTQLAPATVELSNGQRLTRRWLSRGVVREDFTQDGLAGVLFSPEHAADLPATICLPGSGGGVSPQIPALLAGHGMVTLSLPYYGVPGLPADLVEIPVEYVERAMQRLADRPQVDAARLALEGVSKGAELALLAASLLPNIAAVVAYAPSSQTHGWNGKPCWTWRGQGLPFAAMDRSGNRRSPNGRFSIRSGYESTIRDPAETERCAIPVERITAKVMLVSGGDDQTWPSDIFARRVVARAKGVRVEHLTYPRAGHVTRVPNQPRVDGDDSIFDDGGSPMDNAAASRDSWPRVVEFLRNAGHSRG
jgi:dienelactone hydrolase